MKLKQQDCLRGHEGGMGELGNQRRKNRKMIKLDFLCVNRRVSCLLKTSTVDRVHKLFQSKRRPCLIDVPEQAPFYRTLEQDAATRECRSRLPEIDV